jgi:hypothetical protein
MVLLQIPVSPAFIGSMGISGSYTWRYFTVPFFRPYEFWGYSLKFRPKK